MADGKKQKQAASSVDLRSRQAIEYFLLDSDSDLSSLSEDSSQDEDDDVVSKKGLNWLKLG